MADTNGVYAISLTEELFQGLGGVDLPCGDTQSVSSSYVTYGAVVDVVRNCGILPEDPRIAPFLKALLKAAGNERNSVPKETFLGIARLNMPLLHRIATGELAVADFRTFSSHLDFILSHIEPNRSGHNADYIPVLRDADPEKLGVSFCSVDGQMHEKGDTRHYFSIQSTSKAVTFAAALQTLGKEYCLKWVGVEPSGRMFNDMSLLADGRPFNPMVNSGAMMTCAVLASGYPDLVSRDSPKGSPPVQGEELCKEVLIPLWSRLCGNNLLGAVGFDDETFLSERSTADTNLAIAYLLRGRTGLPGNVNIGTMLDLYFRACSVKATCAMMSLVAATLANGGRNPITDEIIFDVAVVKQTLSTMTHCGMYNSAGEFFFDVGMPAKSGVSGIIIVVIPNVGGLATFSPRLDENGNSVRGLAFMKELVSRFTFHSYDSLTSLSTGCKLDPRFSMDSTMQRNVERFRWAAKNGDHRAVIFSHLLLDVMVQVAMADGDFSDTEVEMVARAYEEVMADTVTRDEIFTASRSLQSRKSQKQQSTVESLSEMMKAKGPKLDDICKQFLLEAGFRVAAADGKLEGEELALLKALSDLLQVDQEVLELKIREFELQSSPVSALKRRASAARSVLVHA